MPMWRVRLGNEIGCSVSSKADLNQSSIETLLIITTRRLVNFAALPDISNSSPEDTFLLATSFLGTSRHARLSRRNLLNRILL